MVNHPNRSKRFTVRSAIASYLGEDVAEIESRRYQPTRTPCAVYTDGNDYLTATNGSRRPAESKDYLWRRVTDPGSYCDHMGWSIWERAEEGRD